MSLGSWDPESAEAAANARIDRERLQQFIGWSREERLEQLEDLLGAELQAQAGLMTIDATEWTAAAGSLGDAELLQLIRFFAVAENLPGWEAAERSPVIPLAKALRGRGQRLDRDFLLWLRSVNDNRFLPYGPL